MRDTVDFLAVMAIIVVSVIGDVVVGVFVDIPRTLWALGRDLPSAFRE